MAFWNGQIFKSTDLLSYLLPGIGEGKQEHNLKNNAHARHCPISRMSRFAWQQSSCVIHRIWDMQEKQADIRCPGHVISHHLKVGTVFSYFPCSISGGGELLQVEGLFHDVLLLRIINVLYKQKWRQLLFRCHGLMSGWSALDRTTHLKFVQQYWYIGLHITV